MTTQTIERRSRPTWNTSLRAMSRPSWSFWSVQPLQTLKIFFFPKYSSPTPGRLFQIRQHQPAKSWWKVGEVHYQQVQNKYQRKKYQMMCWYFVRPNIIIIVSPGDNFFNSSLITTLLQLFNFFWFYKQNSLTRDFVILNTFRGRTSQKRYRVFDILTMSIWKYGTGLAYSLSLIYLCLCVGWLIGHRFASKKYKWIKFNVSKSVS